MAKKQHSVKTDDPRLERAVARISAAKSMMQIISIAAGSDEEPTPRTLSSALAGIGYMLDDSLGDLLQL